MIKDTQDVESQISLIQSYDECNDSIIFAMPLLKEESTSLAAATALLERLRMDLEDEHGTKKILSAICYHAVRHFAITEQVLQLLQVTSCPKIVVEFIPQLVGNDFLEISKVVHEFASLLRTDRTLLVPIIGALF